MGSNSVHSSSNLLSPRICPHNQVLSSFYNDDTKAPRSHMPEPRVPGSEVAKEGFKLAQVSLHPTASPRSCCSLYCQCSSSGQLLLQPNHLLLKEALHICSSHLLLLGDCHFGPFIPFTSHGTFSCYLLPTCPGVGKTMETQEGHCLEGKGVARDNLRLTATGPLKGCSQRHGKINLPNDQFTSN